MTGQCIHLFLLLCLVGRNIIGINPHEIDSKTGCFISSYTINIERARRKSTFCLFCFHIDRTITLYLVNIQRLIFITSHIDHAVT